MQLLTRESTQFLNEMYGEISKGFKKMGATRIRLTAKPTPLGNDEVEGARMTLEITFEGETSRVAVVMCRNIIDEKTVLIISGMSSPDGSDAEIESIIKSIIRR